MSTTANNFDHSAYQPPDALGFLPGEELLFGYSEAMQPVRLRAKALAGSALPVLIQGESGTGKELLAQFLHRSSPFARRPFVKIACAAIPEPLFESELFGYEPGAFTGARLQKPGRVSMADGGTLFLDEMGELDLSIQPKLLQFLQSGEYCAIGGAGEKHVNFRLICASNNDLKTAVAAGTFREDLFFRISVCNISLPPLRERSGDVPQLAQHFLHLYNLRFGRQAKPLAARTLKALQRYHWPGNIRQLENLIKRYVILDSEEIIAEELAGSEHPRFQVPDFPIDGSIALSNARRAVLLDFERHMIVRALKVHGYNRARTARALHISYRTLLYKLKNMNIVIE
jgi:two-component system response regulator AtoC